MNIIALIDSFATALADNAALADWCNTTYSRVQKVFVNIDKRNPPGEADCPFVVIHPISKTAGLVNQKKQAFEVDCCIFDESVRTDGQVTEYNSVRRIEEFRKLVETAIISTDIGNALFETVNVEYDLIDSFPYCWAGMEIEISEQFVTGTNPFE